MLDRLAERLPPGWKHSATPEVEHVYSVRVGGAAQRPHVRHYHLLYADASRVARTLDLEVLLDSFESEVGLLVAELARRRVFVHAGVVGWRGRAILVPGRTFTGKSTLVAALVRAGATYYSDEFAVLDERGRVHPYPRPLSLREGELARRCPPEDLGAETGCKPLPVGLIAVTPYRAGSRWRPRSLSAGRALLALLKNTVPARRRPRASMQALRHAVAGARALNGARGEADEVAERLLHQYVV